MQKRKPHKNKELESLKLQPILLTCLEKKAIYMKENVSKTIKKNSAVQFSKSLNKTEKKENHLKLG